MDEEKTLVSILQDASLREAAQLMRKHDVAELIVLEDDETAKPIGIITEHDIVFALADNLPLSLTAKDILHKRAVSPPKPPKPQAGAPLLDPESQLSFE